MYKQIPMQNQNIKYQNYNIPNAQNPNQILANNQLLYQKQLAQQQAMQRNQAQMQNIQKAHQAQNIQNYPNAQKIQQNQNIQNMHKMQQIQKNQNIQNTQMLHNTQIPQIGNAQQMKLNNGHKTYINPQMQKNMINPQGAKNIVTNQNIQHQININQARGLNPQINHQLNNNGVNHLDINPTNNLQHIQGNIPGHIHQQQQKLRQQNLHHNLNQNQIQQQKKEPMMENLKNTALPGMPNQNQQVQPVMENLKNTAFMGMPENAKAQGQQKLKNQVQAKRSATLMTLNSLANIPYNEYPEVEVSKKQFYNISGYAANSYNGKIKSYNEDKYTAILAQERPNVINGTQTKSFVSYFGLFDGHGGNKCSIFLKNKMHDLLLNSKTFPTDPLLSIKDAFKNAEMLFYKEAVSNGKMIDKSGSCAVISLIIDNTLYSINLGDSRALYSRDGGKEFYQITRDHKPNDEIEQKRITNAGGKVFYANKTVVNGVEITLKEENFGKGFTFPYRLSPSGLAVARTIGDYYSKIPQFGGVKGTNVYNPCVNIINIDDKSDFILLGCDGIYDRLENEQILNKIWSYKKAGKPYDDIHALCAKIVDAIIKYSMEKESVDNVTVIFVAFKNFENKMKDPDFEYKENVKCKTLKDNYDFSLSDKIN